MAAGHYGTCARATGRPTSQLELPTRLGPEKLAAIRPLYVSALQKG
jgi:hypothetical protein